MSTALLLAAALAASEAPPPNVPWYVPRQASLGLAVSPLLSPQAHLLWEAAFVDQAHDRVVAIVELGGGHALPPLPAPIALFYQYAALVGLGYRYESPTGLHWGFHAGTGPVLFGARLTTGERSENLVSGIVSGAAQIGFRAAGASWGLQLRYSEPYERVTTRTAPLYLGGLFLGVFANWR